MAVSINGGTGIITPGAQVDTGSGYNILQVGANDSTGYHLVNELSGLNVYTGELGSGTKHLGIDSAGRVTMPYQPAFRAYDNRGGHFTEYGDIPFNATHENIGNHFNTANGVFTAPIAGRYLFMWNSYTDSFNAGSHRAFLRKNGLDQIQTGNSGNGVPITLIIHLSAGDTVTLGGNPSYPIRYYRASAHNEFSGYLLG
jgi:hypothetical protein